MKNHSIYMDEVFFNKTLLSATRKLKDFISKNKNLLLEDFYVGESQGLHGVSKFLNTLPKESLTYAKLVSKTILQSEGLSGGSSIIGLLFFSIFLEKVIKEEGLRGNAQNIKKNIEAANILFKKEIESKMKPASDDIVKNYIFGNVKDHLLASAIYEAINVSGIEGKIYIEESKNAIYVVEKFTGYEFPLKPISFFLPKTSISNLEINDCKIMLVDGIVDKISEIDQLLRYFFNNKESAVVIARGFSEEVVGTLKANYDRDLLKIIPVVLESDLESLNVLNDVACVSGSDIISAMKGDLLTLVRPESLASVNKIRCVHNKIIIENSSTLPAVASHLEYLLKKRYDNQLLDDVVDLYDKRIKTLSQNTTVIRLPNATTLEQQTNKAKIDVVLRDIKSIINNGIVSSKDLTEMPKIEERMQSLFFQSIEETFSLLNKAEVSSLSAYVGVYIFAKMAETILATTGMVVSTSQVMHLAD